MNDDVFAERVKTIRDPEGIQTQDLYSFIVTIKPLGPLAEECKTSYISSIAWRPQPDFN